MFCRYCGNNLPDDSNFCSVCGRSTALISAAVRSTDNNESVIDEEISEDSTADTNSVVEKSFCKSCGKEISAGTKLCKECETRLQNDTINPSSNIESDENILALFARKKESIPSTRAFCKFCGKEIPAGTILCDDCKRSTQTITDCSDNISSPPIPPIPIPKDSSITILKKNATVRYIVCFSLVILLFVGVIIAITNAQNKQEQEWIKARDTALNEKNDNTNEEQDKIIIIKDNKNNNSNQDAGDEANSISKEESGVIEREKSENSNNDSNGVFDEQMQAIGEIMKTFSKACEEKHFHMNEYLVEPKYDDALKYVGFTVYDVSLVADDEYGWTKESVETTADYLLNDVFSEQIRKHNIKDAMCGFVMDINIPSLDNIYSVEKKRNRHTMQYSLIKTWAREFFEEESDFITLDGSQIKQVNSVLDKISEIASANIMFNNEHVETEYWWSNDASFDFDVYHVFPDDYPNQFRWYDVNINLHDKFKSNIEKYTVMEQELYAAMIERYRRQYGFPAVPYWISTNYDWVDYVWIDGGWNTHKENTSKQQLYKSEYYSSLSDDQLTQYINDKAEEMTWVFNETKAIQRD